MTRLRRSPFRAVPLLLASAVALSALPRSAAADPAPPAGFVPLFNGKDLVGWHGWAIHEKGAGPLDLAKLSPQGRAAAVAGWTEDAKRHWCVDNGELVNDGKGAYLATDKEYGDIELRVEYRTVAKADSGIYLRATPQVQIWDTTEAVGKWDRNADKGSGGLFNNARGAPGQLPLVHADRPFGEWNAFRILMVGERTTVYLNDKLVVDFARLENFWGRLAKQSPVGALPKAGAIVLQTHGGEIRWRNAVVREIPAAEANAILGAHAAEGFKPLFNGKDLAGWAGATDAVEVKDGAMVWRLKKGGNLYFDEEFGDFAARVEYKLPPGGNNGLAVRYPGTGTPSQTGMCEVQMLDDTAAKYAKLDPRQYNGAVYGMVAPHLGYLRPVGEWNFMEVTCKGHAVRIELNGTRIVDADVSAVTEFKDKSAHPGRLRLKGYFGFAGHNDPVEFRNVALKRLDGK